MKTTPEHNQRMAQMTFASVYPHYIKKVESKGRTKEELHRSNNYGSLLIEKAKTDSRKAGFDYVYLSTVHIGFYEKHGFKYIGKGYHPWGDESRIYQCKL